MSKAQIKADDPTLALYLDQLSLRLRNPEHSAESIRKECAQAMHDAAAEIRALRAELDPPVCRQQFPDGTVPGNARDAAEGWKRWAEQFQSERDALRAVVEKLPKTADGIFVIPGRDEVWHPTKINHEKYPSFTQFWRRSGRGEGGQMSLIGENIMIINHESLCALVECGLNETVFAYEKQVSVLQLTLRRDGGCAIVMRRKKELKQANASAPNATAVVGASGKAAPPTAPNGGGVE